MILTDLRLRIGEFRVKKRVASFKKRLGKEGVEMDVKLKKAIAEGEVVLAQAKATRIVTRNLTLTNKVIKDMQA